MTGLCIAQLVDLVSVCDQIGNLVSAGSTRFSHCRPVVSIFPMVDKEAVGAETYEEAIIRLLQRTETESAFGSMTGGGPWTDVDRCRARSDQDGV